MPSAIYELDENSPMAWHLKLAVSFAAKASGATLLLVERTQGTIRMTFDRDISQKLIVDMLEVIRKSSVKKVDIQRDPSYLAGGD